MNTIEEYAVNPPAVPGEVLAIAAGWHGGQASMLYAIASTGGLTVNSRRAQYMSPVEHVEALHDLWYWLWRELQCVVEAGDLEQSVCDQVASVVDALGALLETLHP